MSTAEQTPRRGDPPTRLPGVLARLSERQLEMTFGAALLIIVLAVFAVGEVLARAHSALRTTAQYDWGPVFDAMETGDGDMPITFQPNARVGNMRINALGFRGPDIPAEKPRGTVRLAFLGDSKILNAEFDEAEMFASVTARQLGAMLPACAFDHVTVAGPAYHMGEIAQLVQSDIAALQPDVYILLAGTLGEALELHAERNPGAHYQAEHWELARHSMLWDKLSRAFHLARQDRVTSRRAPLPDEAIAAVAASISESADALKAAAGETPLVAIGYRGKLRSDQSHDAQMENTRTLRAVTKGLSASELARLGDHVADVLAERSARHGWTFIDPIAGIAPNEANFFDHTHLTRVGIETLSSATADVLHSVLSARGVTCASSGSNESG